MDSSEWTAGYKCNGDKVLLLELDLRSPMTGRPPANMSLDPNSSGNQYTVKGTAFNESEWSATYNCKKHEEYMKLELDVRSGITGKPPANMYLEPNSSGDHYRVKS